MFDPITAAIIASSPKLSGLDLEQLPKRLTQAFAEIVAARIQFRGQGGIEASLARTLLEMRRLAAAHESYVALLPDRENRSAAAFVAASAHQVYLLSTANLDRPHSYLDGASISSEVCASLLFLVAEAHADAAECAKRISIPTDPRRVVEAALLTAIQRFCFGRLNTVRRVALPELPVDMEPGEIAVNALYLELLKGIKNLADRLLSRVDLDVADGGIESPSSFFNRVKELSVGRLEDVLGTGSPVFSLFPGPLHLANLLLAVDRDLVESALGPDTRSSIRRKMVADNPPYGSQSSVPMAQPSRGDRERLSQQGDFGGNQFSDRRRKIDACGIEDSNCASARREGHFLGADACVG